MLPGEKPVHHSTEQVDHARATSLAASTKPDTHFAHAAAAGNDNTTTRIGCNEVHDRCLLLLREQSRRIGLIAGGLDDRMHRGRILRHCRSQCKSLRSPSFYSARITNAGRRRSEASTVAMALSHRAWACAG